MRVLPLPKTALGRRFASRLARVVAAPISRLSVAAALAFAVASSGVAEAAPKRQRAAAAAARANQPSRTARSAKRPKRAAAKPKSTSASAGAAPAAREAAVAAPSTAQPAAVVKTEEVAPGVKTYTFGAQEVEGRLRSPQILYFLRRVRAEFDPEPLGHRSFLLELSDTRRDPALR